MVSDVIDETIGTILALGGNKDLTKVKDVAVPMTSLLSSMGYQGLDISTDIERDNFWVGNLLFNADKRHAFDVDFGANTELVEWFWDLVKER